MNKKKYMTIGAFAVVIAIALGIAYYFDPAAINNIIGINSTEINAISDADMPALDGTSSSLPVVASETSTDAAAPAPAAAKKPAQKKNNIAGPAAAPAQTSASQGEAVASSSSQSPTAATGDILNDGDLDDASYAAAAATSTPPSCSFPGVAPSSTRKIIFNEIAWMGSPSSSAAEWMEIKNNSADDIDLSGWELMNASGKIKILFSAGDTISSGGLLLLSRGSASGSATANASNAATGAVTTPATKIYSGDLVNTGDVLALMDPQCDVSDYLDASRGWPGGNNTTKQTLERDADGVGWHTSALPGGTPGVENSAGPPPAQYKLTVAFEGNAAGATIASDPAGLIC
ncbi:MAG TPA: lamin tail domain-containing protein, partial [Candidatus Paceibacterota bacterium]|nr:lamin tail domain-containing protein [Candidatus Paceibacterota bacterium]